MANKKKAESVARKTNIGKALINQRKKKENRLMQIMKNIKR